MTNNEPLYVFVHLSKTGGTTLYKHLLQFFTSEDELVYLGPEGDIERKRLGRPPLEERNEDERRRVQILIGHKVQLKLLKMMPWREHRLIFIIRHPVSRMISKYNYQMYLKNLQNNPVPFNKWLAELKPNAWDTSFWLCRRFLGMLPRTIRDITTRNNITENLLRQFYFVSTTERLDQDIAFIFEEMGIPTKMERKNVGGKDHKTILKQTTQLANQILRAVPSELAFYNRWASVAPYWGSAGLPQVNSTIEI